ncbi:TPA: hypothetical protein ACH3X3_007846 [Trebouxia sp. C0006]
MSQMCQPTDAVLAVRVHYMYCPGRHDSLLSHLLILRILLCQLVKLLLSICICQLAVLFLSMTTHASLSSSVSIRPRTGTPAEAATTTARNRKRDINAVLMALVNLIQLARYALHVTAG